MPHTIQKRSKLHTGSLAEETALDYLLNKGLKLVEKNFHSHFGEIDLIMRDQHYLTFIEVRHRRRASHGNALESIGRQKVRKIILTATLYLQQRNWLYTVPCRFDIIAIHPVDGRMQLEWIKNAFTLDS